MTKWQKFWHVLYLFFYDIPERLRNVRRRIWNKRIKLWWAKLWIRGDEFHWSLDIDQEAVIVMNHEERSKYIYNLIERRYLACKKSLSKER